MQQDDPLRALVRELAHDLNSKVAFVCEALGEDHERARAVALSVDGDFLERGEYTVAGTPCEKVLAEGEFHEERDVAQIYPEDRMLSEWRIDAYVGIGIFDSRGLLIGHIGVMNDGPLDEGAARTRLRDSAVRAGRELERRRGGR